MTEKEIRETVKNMALVDIVKFCDTELVYEVKDEETGEYRKVTVSLSMRKNTTSYSEKKNTFKCDGFLVKPNISKTYDKNGILSYWSFDPNTLRINTPASRYTYLVKDGDIIATKDARKYDKDSKAHITEVDKSAIKYLRAKKANELNIENQLRDMCISAMIRYQKAIENANTVNTTLETHLEFFKGTLKKAC